MKRCATVRGRSTSSERKWPIRSPSTELFPSKVRDHEFRPVTHQVTFSARLSTNRLLSRSATRAKISSINFLLSAALMRLLRSWVGEAIVALGGSFFQSIVHMMDILPMNLSAVDLNLLVVLDAL